MRYFRDGFSRREESCWSSSVLKTLEDERYVVIKAYKCTVSEIWSLRFFCISIYCVYVVSLHTESTDSAMTNKLSCISLFLRTKADYNTKLMLAQSSELSGQVALF